MNVSEEVRDGYDRFEEIWVGTVIGLGVIGNIFSLMVFYYTSIRQSPAAIYLSALAISDTVFLLGLLTVYLWQLELWDAYVRYTAFCQVVIYSLNFCACTSTWLVVIFTAERFLVVLYPFHRYGYSTRRRAKKLIFAFLLFPMFWYSGTFKLTGLQPMDSRNVSANGTQRYYCGVVADYKFKAMIFNFLDVVVVLFAPLVIIIGLNIRIARELLKVGRKKSQLEARKQLSKGSRLRNETRERCLIASEGGEGTSNEPQLPQATGNGVPVGYRQSDAVKKCFKDLRTTRMLFLVSSVFVVLNLPHNLASVVEMTKTSLLGPHQTNLEYVAVRLATALYYLNFAINFVLYNTASSNFRFQAKKLLRRVFRCVGSEGFMRPNQSGTMTFNETNSLQVTSLQSMYTKDYIKRGSNPSVMEASIA